MVLELLCQSHPCIKIATKQQAMTLTFSSKNHLNSQLDKTVKSSWILVTMETEWLTKTVNIILECLNYDYNTISWRFAFYNKYFTIVNFLVFLNRTIMIVDMFYYTLFNIQEKKMIRILTRVSDLRFILHAL